jgi:hypothetical protein
MGMFFEELNDNTRKYMLREFVAEQNSTAPYRSSILTVAGLAAFPELMTNALRLGNEQTLTATLAKSGYWSSTETYIVNGITRERKVNIYQAAERLSITEFNTWYVRGLSCLLLHEGVSTCQIYRAGEPKWSPAECSDHEGRIVSVQEIYEGHRARYWPLPGNPHALSIPFAPGCHHTIRRIP